MGPERLQKLLARAGYGSRRSVEALIEAGRVAVNGTIATLGTRADPAHDVITLDGQPVQICLTDTTTLLHKPVDYVVTRSDEQGRPTVYDLLPGAPSNLRYAGRLDIDTSGVLVLSTDGELVHRLTHPRYHVVKVYEARVEGVVSESTLARLRAGIDLDDGRTAPAEAERLDGSDRDTLLRLAIHEGRNRQVRRMLEAAGHRVMVLRRTQVGPVTLGDLAPGASRPLTEEELHALRTLVGLEARAGA